MKIAVILLVLLGLFAAVCAMLLINGMTPAVPGAGAKSAEDEVEVMVATRALPALTVVDGPSVQIKKVQRSERPEGALTNSVQVVGQVLMVPMVEGEVFKGVSFAREGHGVHMAAALPPGKRAISISVADFSGMAGLLYPGSVVDVLVSVRRGGNVQSEMISTTLLQGVQVLAIGSQSVTSEQQKDRNPGAMAAKGQVNHRMVTLLVDSKQAQVLQLAMQNAFISLVMRNPLDTEPVPTKGTRLSELAGGAFVDRTASVGNERPVVPVMFTRAPDVLPTLAKLWSGGGGEKTPPSTRPVAEAERSALSPSRLWEMLIIRGTAVESQTFPMPKAEQSEPRAIAGG